MAKQYTRNPPLDEAELGQEPLSLFLRWLEEATAAGLHEPTAMALATAAADGQPSLRMVLYKGRFEDGICFYTDYRGRKAQELEANPRAAATFWWDKLERQVRLEGAVARVPREVSAAYFASRPRASQLAAHTSRQSAVVANRETLDQRLAETAARFGDGSIPLPEYWGGYVLRPQRVEYWQGRAGRFHDRLRWVRTGSGWRVERLEP